MKNDLIFHSKKSEFSLHNVRQFLKERNITAEMFVVETDPKITNPTYIFRRIVIKFATPEDKMTYILTGYDNEDTEWIGTVA